MRLVPRCGIANPDFTFLKWIFIILMDCEIKRAKILIETLEVDFLDVKVDGN
jgi:hypothetical protein